MTTLLMSLVLACQPQPAATPGVTSTTRPNLETASDGALRNTAVVDLGSLTTRWRAATGWEIHNPQVLEDLDGDGYKEFTVSVMETGVGGSAQLLVAGPVRRSVTLPGDEFARLLNDGGDVLVVSDLNQDGALDLAFSSLYAMLGPFSGDMDVQATGVHFGAFDEALPVDVDGDGIMDWVGTNTWAHTPGLDFSELYVTFGPLARLGTNTPDITIDPSCGDDGDGAMYSNAIGAWPDVDGDGEREIWIDGAQWECPDWLLPFDTGTIAVDATPGAYEDVPQFEVIADRTGDGLPDVWVDSAVDTVFEAPVTFREGSITSASWVEATEVSSLRPAEFDVTGDGIGDFLVIDRDIEDTEVVLGLPGAPGQWEDVLSEVLTVLPGGPDLALPGPYTTVWDIQGGSLVGRGGVEDGQAYTLVVRDGEVVIVDLGSGTAVH